MNSAERAKILLVDDRPENLLALESILEPLGQPLIQATSGEEALRCVLQHDFAVILLDVQMPGLNGFETAAIVKSRARSRHTPIIFLTAISKEEHFISEGYSVGAVDYMPKPLHPEILRSKVGVFVDLYVKNREIERQARLLRESQRRELELRYAVRLQESEARATQIVETVREAIVTFDADRRVTLFNRAAETIFGISAEEVVAREVELFLHPDARAEFMMQLARIDTGEDLASLCAVTYTGIRADGTEFPFEASLSRLELAGGPSYTLVGRDISSRHLVEQALRRQAIKLASATTELRMLNEKLQQRQSELEHALNARSRFYASMSHEIRTPINAIIGYCSLLLDDIFGPLNEKQLHGVERTGRAAQHLLELVNDVLDISKIDAGKVELEYQQVVFPELVEDLFVTLRPLAEEFGSELALIEEGEPREIRSDPRRIRQILLNLVSNAIKFGLGQPVRVVYSAGPAGGVELAITDQGAGIATEDLPKIFEEFVQLPSATRGEGTGLGLPISRRLANFLGGTITAESVEGAGSTFRLTLPLHPPGEGHADERYLGVDGARGAEFIEYSGPQRHPSNSVPPSSVAR